jgi:hypothetical protein
MAMEGIEHRAAGFGNPGSWFLDRALAPGLLFQTQEKFAHADRLSSE